VRYELQAKISAMVWILVVTGCERRESEVRASSCKSPGAKCVGISLLGF
jgi:hypothetical protein